MPTLVADGNDALTGHIISTTISGKNGEPKQVQRVLTFLYFQFLLKKNHFVLYIHIYFLFETNRNYIVVLGSKPFNYGSIQKYNIGSQLEVGKFPLCLSNLIAFFFFNLILFSPFH